MRVGLYGTNLGSIPINQYMIIREPQYKRANDSLSILRVDNPKQVDFLDTSFLEVKDLTLPRYYYCVIKNVKISKR